MSIHRATAARRLGGSGFGIALSIGALAALGLGLVYTQGAFPSRKGIDADRVVAVERRDLVDGVTASGRVEPLARVAVMSRASGIIKELRVDEGDLVAKGEVLAELDREQLEAQIVRDRAELDSAEARLAGARARLAEARVRLEDPDLVFWEREDARLAQLYGSGDVTLRQREEAERALAAVRFRVALVQASLPVLEAAEAEAEANRAVARAALEQSETFLREATIRSPIDGVVLVREREVGDGVSSILTAGGGATLLMSLGDLSRMHVEARVDEVDLGRIHAGMPAVVTVDAHRGKALAGRVARIAPAGSVDNNGIVTFHVRVSVDDPEGLLRPDMTADARLVVARRDGALTLPQRAFLREADGGWTVLRVVGEGREARTERVAVELGLSDGLRTEVARGLAEGERVLLPLSASLAGARP